MMLNCHELTWTSCAGWTFHFAHIHLTSIWYIWSSSRDILRSPHFLLPELPGSPFSPHVPWRKYGNGLWSKHAKIPILRYHHHCLDLWWFMGKIARRIGFTMIHLFRLEWIWVDQRWSSTCNLTTGCRTRGTKGVGSAPDQEQMED